MTKKMVPFLCCVTAALLTQLSNAQIGQYMSLAESSGPIAASTTNTGSQQPASASRQFTQLVYDFLAKSSTNQVIQSPANRFPQPTANQLSRLSESLAGTPNGAASNTQGGSASTGSQTSSTNFLDAVTNFVQNTAGGQNPAYAISSGAGANEPRVGNSPPPNYATGVGSPTSNFLNPAMAAGQASMGGVGVGDMGATQQGMNPSGVAGAGIPPFSNVAPMVSRMLSRQALLKYGQKMGDRTGVRDYYQIHGCVDPTRFFSGQQRSTASMAMAQGCQSLQAQAVCKMAQVKARVGNSLLTSSVLPPAVRSRLENCISAKAFLNSIFSLGQPGVPITNIWNPFTVNQAECNALLSSVLDGSSLDPETMIDTRRSMLPWSCNESAMGPHAVPYRVCCPGQVGEPTLSEARVIRRMVNA